MTAHRVLGALVLAATVAGCGTTPRHAHASVQAATPPVTYACMTGWTPEPLGTEYPTEPFHYGPEPAWAAPAAGGRVYEYPAWEIAAASHTSRPVYLDYVTIVYYAHGGQEIGSEDAEIGPEVLTSHQVLNAFGPSQIAPAGAWSCQVIGGQS